MPRILVVDDEEDLSGEHNLRVIAASLAVRDFLLKPIELALLLNVVQRYCSF